MAILMPAVVSNAMSKGKACLFFPAAIQAVYNLCFFAPVPALETKYNTLQLIFPAFELPSFPSS